MNCAAIAPVQNDANQQVAQIEAKLAAGEIDCIGIEPVDSNSLTAVTNKPDGRGESRCSPPACRPTATSSPASPRSRSSKASTLAESVLQWIKDNGKDRHQGLRRLGGDPTQEWAQGRMISFVETIKAAIPDADLRHRTEANGLNTSYEPGQTYDDLPLVPHRQPERPGDRERRHRRRARRPRHREPRPARARSSRSAGTRRMASSTRSRRASRSPSSTSAGPTRPASARSPAPPSSRTARSCRTRRRSRPCSSRTSPQAREELNNTMGQQ
jgi:hypothetical protein